MVSYNTVQSNYFTQYRWRRDAVCNLVAYQHTLTTPSSLASVMRVLWVFATARSSQDQRSRFCVQRATIRSGK